MPAIGEDDPGRSYSRGYQDGAVETFRAIERFLDVATREVVHTWIEQDELVFDAQCPLRVKSGGDHQGVSLRMSALPPKADISLCNRFAIRSPRRRAAGETKVRRDRAL